MSKVDVLKAIKEMPVEAVAAIEQAFGKDEMLNVTPTVIKPFGNKQAIILKVVEENGQRKIDVEATDALIILPESKDTLDIYESDGSEVEDE